MTSREPLDDNMQDRINNLFSGQEPPSHASIRDVEAMKVRIRELEAELARQSGSEPDNSDVTGDKQTQPQDDKSRAPFSHWSSSSDSQPDANNRKRTASTMMVV